MFLKICFFIYITPMNNRKFGQKFKNLRLEKNYSLDSVSVGITAKSSLYNWENGKGNMAFDKVILMLNRMHIEPTELISDSVHNSIDINDIFDAYNCNDVVKLRQIAQQALDKSRKYQDDKSKLIRSAIACQYLKALTGLDLFLKEDKEQLEQILSEINEWHYIDVFCFGNTLALIPDKRIYGLTKSLIRKYLERQNDNYAKWQHGALNTIINAISTLLYNDLSLALKLSSEIQLLQLNDTFAYEKIRIKFVNEILNYCKTQNDKELSDCFFPALNYLGLNQLNSDLNTAFAQFETKYRFGNLNQ